MSERLRGIGGPVVAVAVLAGSVCLLVVEWDGRSAAVGWWAGALAFVVLELGVLVAWARRRLRERARERLEGEELARFLEERRAGR